MNWGEILAAFVSAVIGAVCGGFVVVHLVVDRAVLQLKAGLSIGEDGFPPRREVSLRFHDVERRLEQVEAAEKGRG